MPLIIRNNRAEERNAKKEMKVIKVIMIHIEDISEALKLDMKECCKLGENCWEKSCGESSKERHSGKVLCFVFVMQTLEALEKTVSERSNSTIKTNDFNF